jgi:Amt family ammonium transporter
LDSGDTAFVLISAALVMFMIPGLALFYGGMVRAKNVLATVMQSFFCMGLVSVLWVLAAYSLAFSPGNKFIGGLDWLGFAGVGQEPNPDLSATIPAIAYAVFQLFFAAITPALITGAFAERMKFSAFALFTTLWLFLVYVPLAHWVWAPGGWLRDLGALDFAGGTVVHMNSGFAALAAAIVIGKRRGFLKEAIVPHNLTLTILGAGILWFGWFGFNAGSALGAGAQAAGVWVNTLAATCTAMLGWLIVEKLRDGHPTSLGAASGVVAGLVAITPACATVSPIGALLVGLAAGAGCALAVGLKFRFGFDDSLDVVGVHLVGGLIGTLLIGFLATKGSPTGAAGLDVNEGVFYGGGISQLLAQLEGALSVLVYSFVVTYLIGLAIHKTIGFRVSESDESQGVDLTEHAETAYDLSGLTGGRFGSAVSSTASAKTKEGASA